MLLLLACTADPIDSGRDAYVDTSQTLDTSDWTSWPEDTGPEVTSFDADGDGVYTPDDCDDDDATVYPGATESWNDVDDDCDGQIDGDGSYAGTLSVSITAVKEGVSYSWTNMSCPAELSREAALVDFTVTCTPTSSGSRVAVQDELVGQTIVLSPYPGDEDVTGESWSGWLSMASEAFDTEGEAQAGWSSFEALTLSVSDSAFSLSMSGSGNLARQ